MSDRGPDKIWLQCRDIADPENRDVALSEATWCVDEVDSTDEEYVRADLFADLRAEVEQLEYEFKCLVGALEQIQQDAGRAISDPGHEQEGRWVWKPKP